MENLFGLSYSNFLSIQQEVQLSPSLTKIWKVISLYVLWQFGGRERLLMGCPNQFPKQFTLRSLFDWMTTLGSILAFSNLAVRSFEF